MVGLVAVSGVGFAAADQIGARIFGLQRKGVAPGAGDLERFELPGRVQQVNARQALGVVGGKAFLHQCFIICKCRAGEGRLGPRDIDDQGRGYQRRKQDRQRHGQDPVSFLHATSSVFSYGSAIIISHFRQFGKDLTENFSAGIFRGRKTLRFCLLLFIYIKNHSGFCRFFDEFSVLQNFYALISFPW